MFWKILFVIIILYLLIQSNENANMFEFFNPNINTLTNTCSPLCCYSGWPNTIIVKDKYNNLVQSDIGSKYTTSNYTCNNGVQTGCLCNKLIKK